MNESQRRQKEDAVRLAHATCCDAAGEAENRDITMSHHMSHEAHMKSHAAQKGHINGENLAREYKMYDE